MSILIKGMEMPHDENDSIHIMRDGTAVVYRSGSIDFYKAIPVPPHGRLIDGDAFTDLMFADPYQDFIHILGQMPTTIEAEGGE